MVTLNSHRKLFSSCLIKAQKCHKSQCLSSLVIKKVQFDDLYIQQKVGTFGFKGVPIIHHHDYVSELPPGHQFPMKKFHGVMKFLKKDGLVSMKQVVRPEAVTLKVAKFIHTSEYTHSFFTGQTTDDEQRRTGFKWSEGLLRRCRLETGGSILGAELAIQRGLACSTGGGTHHAHPSFGSGFCLLNDLAIAAKYVISTGLASKVLIVDLDVHQGDGTAVAFNDDDKVFTFSMHAEKNFPFRKQVGDLDVGLPDKTPDETYMRILCHHLPSVLYTFRPDLVLYNAGVDPHFKDELGRLNITDSGLFERDYYVINECVSRGIPCMTVIGGGYSKDIQELALRHTIVHRAAIKVWIEKGL